MSTMLHDLGIEPGALLVNIVGFVLLLYLMKRFVFPPIGTFIDQRRDQINDDLDNAKAARDEAEREKAAAASNSLQIELEARQAAEAARDNAKREADALIKEARDQARDAERAARAATERDQVDAAKQLRSELSGSAAQMCRSLLVQALDQERHRALMDSFIADVERLASQQPGSQ